MIHGALERALVQRTVGYDYMGEEIFCSREGDVVRTRILKCVPPETEAPYLVARLPGAIKRAFPVSVLGPVLRFAFALFA
jgi:hypothetical protein